jgi:hypothetical protein
MGSYNSQMLNAWQANLEGGHLVKYSTKCQSDSHHLSDLRQQALLSEISGLRLVRWVTTAESASIWQ